MGKTEIASTALLWFLNCFYPSTVFSTAPTFRQVRTILWRKVRTQYNQARFPLGGTILETEIKLAPNWFAMGISSKNADSIQGYHPIGTYSIDDVNLLFIIDEAPGVQPEIFEAIENVMASGGNVRMLLLGNPSALSGEFYDAFHSKRSVYNLIHIDGEDTPNVKAGQIVVPGLITKDWIEERKKIWGADSPLYQVKVKGNFPRSEADTLIPVDWVEQAVNRNDEVRAESTYVIGCDPARYGDDETVIAVRGGRKIVKIMAYNGLDTMQTVGHIINLHKEYGMAKIRVDEIGVGGGIVDRLQEQGYPVEGVNVGEQSSDPEQFINLRAELWWRLRELLDPKNENALALPKDDVLLGQLTSVKFKVSSTRGKIQIESKEEIRKKGLRSPDRAEAVLMTIASMSQAVGFLDWMKDQVEDGK